MALKATVGGNDRRIRNGINDSEGKFDAGKLVMPNIQGYPRLKTEVNPLLYCRLAALVYLWRMFG